MVNIQAQSSIKKQWILIGLLLLAFFLKSVFIATVFPIFSGQDEARHYNTVQYLAQPEDVDWPIVDRESLPVTESFLDYNFSQEIRNAGIATNFDIVRHLSYGTAPFESGYDGKNEALIDSKPWRPVQEVNPPDLVSNGRSIFHILASYLEKIFSESSILVRFFIARIFSLFWGTLAVLLTYIICRNIGMTFKNSLILSSIVAFQPKLSMYTTNINYDSLLIVFFFLFTLGGILSLKDGPNWKNIAVMIFSIVLGIFTKGTAIVMLGVFIPLVAYHMVIRSKDRKKAAINLVLFCLIVMIALVALNLKYSLEGLLPHKGNTAETFSTLVAYLDKSITMGRLGLSARTYWGDLSWSDNWLSGNITLGIWFIEGLAAIGIAILLFTKKKLDFLPDKKYIIFLVAMLAALQFGIRLFDWNTFIGSGRLNLGTPGRYFLPNLAPHIILVFVGLGALLKKEKYFNLSLAAGMIMMFAFSMYIIFDVVIPRTYL